MKRTLLLGLGAIFLAANFGTANASFNHHNISNKRHHSVHAHKVKSVQYTGVVNLNTANVKQLSSLKGIGMKKAEAIIAYRKKSGTFHSIKDLQGVKGIGGKFIQRLTKNNRGRVIVKT